MPFLLFHLLSLLFLLLADAFRRDKDVPEFVIIGKCFLSLYSDFFYNPYKVVRSILFKTVNTDDVIG